MDIIRTLADLEEFGRKKAGCVLTIGNFDGVHIGHSRIIKRAGELAGQLRTALAVMTFEPHPAAILHPQRPPGLLTPPALKRFLLEQLGVEYLIVLEDNLVILNLAPDDFVRRFLVGCIRPAVLVEGENFHFGYGRSGSVHTLAALGAQNGFRVEVIEQEKARLSIGHAVEVSSTLVRDLLSAGKVHDAAAALGRPYMLMGKTVAGRGKGRQLGFPTANIEPVDQVVPAEGVYAGLVKTSDDAERLCAAARKEKAALSIGRAKTFISDHPLLVEAHILGRTVGQLEGSWLAMEFIERIRGQRRFKTKTALSDQIGLDCRKISRVLERVVDGQEKPNGRQS